MERKTHNRRFDRNRKFLLKDNDLPCPNTFSGFQNYHIGKTIIVCGCGSSLSNFNKPDEFITIGVNDVGRQFDPDYLVVLNPRSQFKHDRFRYVEQSCASALFTQLNLGIKHPNIVRFKLGQRGGTDCSSLTSLPYTRNSPYVALCMAAFMGAKRIGLIGVDFTDNHFFSKTGRHSLRTAVGSIDKEYGKLAAALAEVGIEVVNLSENSLIKGLDKMAIEDFVCQRMSGSKPRKTRRKTRRKTNNGRIPMIIQIEKHRGNIIGGFFDRLAKTANKLGHSVERRVSPYRPDKRAIAVVWNGRRYRNDKHIIYCEHGWLPREAYQVSPGGINADSHIAPFEWNGKSLSAVQRNSVLDYLESLKSQNSSAQEYTSAAVPAVKDLPPKFLLVPLQLEQDTNIVRHVSPNLRKMQSFIDFISQSNPPFPVIYKQHPADIKRGSSHLRLKMRRKHDFLRPHESGNIHQILKSGCCKGIVSLNSNVVHDGFLWDVPAIVLGRNIWPREGVSPFLNVLPKDWRVLEGFYAKDSIKDCRESYIHYLMGHQWKLSDANDFDKVGDLFERKAYEVFDKKKLVSITSRMKNNSRQQMLQVNVVATNKGWLFEDLKKHFSRLRMPGVKVVSTEKPLRNSNSWLFLRASEAARSPDSSRTLVQIHDQFDDGMYAKGGSRHVIKDCGGICFTHPDQKEIVESNNIDLSGKQVLINPMGALKSFTLRKNLPDKFTVAWIGRPVQHNGKDFKRVEWFVDSLRQSSIRDELSTVLIGDRLQRIRASLSALGIEAHYFPRSKYGYEKYPNYYHNIDCVVITSKFAAGPNCLFESLASGVPVISTPCGWASDLVKNGRNGFIVESPREIGAAIEKIYQERLAWFSRREAIRASGLQYSLEAWLDENVRMAVSLGSKQDESVARRVVV